MRPEETIVLLGRKVGIVDGVGVQEEEEPVLPSELPKEGETALEGQPGLAAVSACLEFVEPPIEAKILADEAGFGVARGPETGAPEPIGQAVDQRRERARRRVDTMLLRVEPGEHRDVRDQGRRILDEGALE